MSASKSRGKNWSVEEDEALCTAWLNVSQDGATGTYQKLDTLYERIYEMFIEICTEKNLSCSAELRVPSGLKARWLLISKACSKFSGCVAQISARQQSGTTQSDVFKQAFTLYNTSTKSPFSLLHAYKILECAPKWKQYVDIKVAAVNSSKRRQSEENEDDEPISTASSSRPMGQKASKKLKLQQTPNADIGAEIVKASNLLAKAAEKKALLSRERTMAINRMANHAIMSVDFSTLSDIAKKYYKIEQERILEEAMPEHTATGSLDAIRCEEVSDEPDEEDFQSQEMQYLEYSTESE